MSSGIDLAGAIGTWAAVALALVALGGILPAYFLYSASKTQKAQALALVDDPSHSFVRRIGLPGMKLSRLSRLPDLRKPPDLQVLETLPPPEPKTLSDRRSTTSWVNFALVVGAMFPGVRKTSGEVALEYKDEQTYLPVHCLWVLLLGVIHRYADRIDDGLPWGVPRQRTISLRENEEMVSGQSGKLVMHSSRSSPGHHIKVTFESHSYEVVKKILQQSKISVSNLLLLLLGYIKLVDGAYISMRDARKLDYEQTSRGPQGMSAFAERILIATVRDGIMPRQDESILLRMNLGIPRVMSLLLHHPDEAFPRHSWNQLSPEYLRNEGYYEIGESLQEDVRSCST